MNQIEKEVLNKVTAVLGKLGLEYAIKDSDGTIHGDLKPAQAKPKKKSAIYGYGVLSAHLRKTGVTTMMPNTTLQVPVGTFAPEIVRRSIATYGSKNWGNGSYTTSISSQKTYVEVTRFDTTVADFVKNDPLADILKDWN